MTSILQVLRRQRAEEKRSIAADDDREAEAVETEWQRLYRQHFAAAFSPLSPAASACLPASPPSGCIPRFYFPPASSASSPSASLGEQFRLLCRESQLQRAAEQRLDDADIAAVWAALSSAGGEDGSLSRLSSSASSASVTATSLSLSYSALLQSPLDVPLSYSRFRALAQAVPAVKRAAHFNAAAFALLPRLPSASACISPRLLLLHLLYSSLTARLRISLLSYASPPSPSASSSSESAAWLSEQELMNYVHDDLQRRQPEAFEPDFLPYYVFAAVRKLLFFLDPGRTGRVPVERLVHSSLMQEWEHRRAGDSAGQQEDGDERGDSERRQTPTKEQLAMGRKGREAASDAATPLRQLREALVQAAATASAAGETTVGQSALPSALFSCTDPGRLSAGSAASTRPSWFAASNSQAVYALYLSLDTDHNGMLSQAELAAFHGGSFTPALLDALFSSVPLYLSTASSASAAVLEMDYKAFLDLILALEYPHTASSLRYFFTLLDTERAGRLSRSCVMRWFRAVRCRLQELGHEGVVSEAVLADELWDMVGPEQADGLRLTDLLRCRCGHTVVSILTDVNGFWRYDHRETLMAQQQQQTQQQ